MTPKWFPKHCPNVVRIFIVLQCILDYSNVFCCIQIDNTSSWGTAVLRRLSQNDPSDIILLMETRLVDTLVPAQVRRAYHLGWSASSSAMRKIANSTSTGCAILCRSGLYQSSLTEALAHRPSDSLRLLAGQWLPPSFAAAALPCASASSWRAAASSAKHPTYT